MEIETFVFCLYILHLLIHLNKNAFFDTSQYNLLKFETIIKAYSFIVHIQYFTFNFVVPL